MYQTNMNFILILYCLKLSIYKRQNVIKNVKFTISPVNFRFHKLKGAPRIPLLETKNY